MVVSQMRCAGLLEVCRIRKMGFPVRLLTENFIERYSMLEPAMRNASELLQELVKKGAITSDGFALGKTKVFLRDALRNHLDGLRDACLMGIVIKIQTVGRRFVVQLRYATYQRIVTCLHEVVKKRIFHAC